MSHHEDETRLRHMLDHAAEAIEMVRGRTRRDIDADRQLNLALVRLLEIVGEAAARVSHEGRERCAEIPWQEIIGLRNRLAHGYDEVDFDILWHIVQGDLPPLITRLKKALERISSSPAD
ncbi:MAG: DUF86 domain-containing protein [Deltaproteobacteria bacterium]|nr:DUF86 domain-containing protein [Deltaproteobacteria bacterium]